METFEGPSRAQGPKTVENVRVGALVRLPSGFGGPRPERQTQQKFANTPEAHENSRSSQQKLLAASRSAWF